MGAALVGGGIAPGGGGGGIGGRNWFEPRWGGGGVGIAGGMVDIHSSSGGIGLGWVRGMLGGGEWRVPLLGVDVRL